MPERTCRPDRRNPGHRRPARTVLVAAVLIAAALAGTLSAAGPAWAEPAVQAFPAPPATSDAALAGGLPCLPIDPLCVAGQLAGAAVGDVWTAAMTSLWQAGLWVLGLAFRVVDALTTPDLSAEGPLGRVYPVTFGLGAAVAVLMALVQLGSAAARRDGRALGRLLVGLGQFGLVWAGYVGVAALLVTGVAGLTRGLLQALLGIDTLAAFDASLSVPRELVNGTVATVLGLSSIFLLFPAAVGYLLVMLVREAALMVLAATSAIAAGGLLAETSRAWFWKSLRWFLSALLISPLAVLVLGVGVQITEGVLAAGPGTGTGTSSTSTEAAVGMAVVGCLLILIGALCPLVLFRLLAFVDPGTSSGAGLRATLAASGGVLGLLGGAGRGTAAAGAGAAGAAGAGAAGAGAAGGVAGSGAAARSAGGRAQGEASAQAATGGRVAGALRALAAGSAAAGRVAGGVAASATDVLTTAGVGHPGAHPAPPGPGRRATPGPRAAGGDGGSPPPPLSPPPLSLPPSSPSAGGPPPVPPPPTVDEPGGAG